MSNAKNTSRCPYLPPSEMNTAQRDIYDEVAPALADKYGDQFVHTLPDGSLTGPLNVHLKTPDLYRPFWNLIGKVFTQPGLTETMLEVIILNIASPNHYDCKYMRYAHIRVAKAVGLDENIRKAVANGEKGSGPGWDLRLDLTWEISTSMLESRGNIPSQLWNKAKQELGEQSLLAIVQVAAAYQYQANLLNAHRQEIPPGEELLA
ncbi:uncharacterized protein L201_006382 [Kwoniella dendrophila CBS 6074]|uniref:Carboxymuconolactone decarboxylase-like domain-containing protein n=1 Tax=Kwoniella dendrophila CBS 6074 TaxID=1295534 RepID=A0AAX4K136_9TREE